MVTVETDTDRRDGVTLVTARVRNTLGTPQTVRLVNRLDGPVWPPRFGDVTAPEWTDGTWEGTLRPGQCLGVGYATPAPPFDDPDETPLEVASSTRSTGDESVDSREVLASLDDWSPPSDTVFSDR